MYTDPIGEEGQITGGHFQALTRAVKVTRTVCCGVPTHKKWIPRFNKASGICSNSEQVNSCVKSGYRYAVDLDLEKFFDTVNHDILMHLVARKVRDKTVDSPLQNLDDWLRRRIRMCYWKQWRYPRKKVRKLMELEILKDFAVMTGASSKSY